VVVTYHGIFPRAELPVPELGPDLQLRPGGEPPLAMTYEVLRARESHWLRWTSVVLRPAQPLRPETTYEVVDRRDALPCYAFLKSPACALGGEVVVAAFTTGARPDTAGPVFQGLRKVRASTAASCAQGATCSSFSGWNFDLEWDAATGDGPVLYNVYERDGQNLVLRHPFVASLKVPGAVVMSGVPSKGFTGGPGRYLVRAVDWAGNEDANTVEMAVGGGCGQPAPIPNVQDPGGCSVASGSSARHGVWLLLALLPVVGRRRQRVPNRRSPASPSPGRM
jgi:MYXO-CTERM domain-containing protein